MVKQTGWDKFETALLIDACEKVSNGTPKQEIIKELSDKLRQRAIRSGQVINDLFRNQNGIALQMSKMDYLLTNGKKGLPGASYFFEKMVELKSQFPLEFNSILSCAQQQIEERSENANMSNKRSQFVDWINSQGKLKIHPNSVVSVLDECSEYAQKHGISKISFWDMEDVNTFVFACRKMSNNRLFRVIKRNIAQTFDKAHIYYKTFLESLSSALADTYMVADEDSATTESTSEGSAVSEHDHISIQRGAAIIRKTVDKSLLTAGLTVPKAVSGELKQKLGVSLAKGEACEIIVLINKAFYQAKLISVNFSEKYSDVEMLQIRYASSSPLGKKINDIFNDAFKKGIKTYVDIYVVGKNQLEFVCSDDCPTDASLTNVAEKSETDCPIQSDGFERGFISWMQNKGMAEATIRSYASSIRSAETYAQEHSIQGVSLTSNNTAQILASIDVLLSNKEFIKHNQEQHNRFSAAFRKMQDYISEVDRRETQITSDTELEVKNPEIYHKLYPISKVFDDPQGLTVDHILAMIASICSKEELIEFLDRISWATKLSEERYTFAKNAIPAVDQPIIEQKHETSEPNDYDKGAFIRVLMSRYQSGMQFDSIDLENFRDTYEDMYDEKLMFSDEELEVRLRYCGILYKDRLFPAEGIIDNGTKERLFAYIENKFATGNKVLYYKAIFSDLADAFAYCFSLTDEQMLKAYIEHTSEQGRYYFHSDFMSTEKTVKLDHSAEIEDFMLAAGKPLSYDEVYEGLSHISKDIIYREIRIGSKFLMNEREHYYHIDIFEFSESDGDRIAEILNKEIEENGYAIWSKVFDHVKEQMPIFIENNLYLSPLGIRNALSQFMAERFDFDGEVISAYGSHLGMADVFRLYAKHNTPFSDTDLYNFSKATDTTIYFWALAEESVRVSKTLFVAKDQIEFDIEATDKALETYLSSGYILVKDVDSFLVFPNVGYEWNEFLLESYLLHYSKKFCLVNNGISLNNVAGAVAKKDGNFTQFVDICAHALAGSGIDLKKTAALNYLADINLITRRSYKELDVAMTKARQIRNQKG